MTYKCVIVDDEELARELMESHLSQLSDFELVATCESAIEASKVLQQQQVDVLFLDIEMPVLKGTDFFKNLIHKPNVIFTTAHRDYALDGFELNAVDYLLKPITFQRFFKAIEKFLAQQNTTISIVESPKIQKTDTEYIFIRKDRKQVKLWFDSILYIESLKDYIKIHLDSDTHVIKHSMSAFEDQLDNRFIRTHRSYIANTDKITAYTKNDVEINSIEIPIGESYKDKVMTRLG